MLSPYQQPQFLSRVFTDCSGRQFRLTFFVAVVDGEVRGRLVSAEPISASIARLTGDASDGSVLCLPITCDSKKPATEYIPAFAPIVSPFFSSLEFLIHSQPTRAPSFA
jgi:hypothetical protein